MKWARYKIMLVLLLLVGCSSADGGESPSIPIYAFYCRHEAVLAAIAIEPYCDEEPIIVVGYVEELGQNHAEAYCQGWVRLIGTRAIGVYSEPGFDMVNEKEYTVNEYMRYFFGWVLE